MARALVHGWRRSSLYSHMFNRATHFHIPFLPSSSIQSRLGHSTSHKSLEKSHQTQPQNGQTKRILSHSKVESNIRRILSYDIRYQFEYSPPQEPLSKFKSFMVEDRPGQQWITLTGKFGEDQNIKIEATMFDGSALVPRTGDDTDGEEVRLHISLLVDIWKGEGEGTELLEFVCSAWPDSLQIQKAYIFRRDGYPSQPYLGPNMKNLDAKLRCGLYKFLKTRGIDNELCGFLHKYMSNKDRIEHIQWLEEVKCFFEE